MIKGLSLFIKVRIKPYFDRYMSVWYLECLTVIKRNMLLCLIGTLRLDDCDGASQSSDHLAPKKQLLSMA